MTAGTKPTSSAKQIVVTFRRAEMHSRVGAGPNLSELACTEWSLGLSHHIVISVAPVVRMLLECFLGVEGAFR